MKTESQKHISPYDSKVHFNSRAIQTKTIPTVGDIYRITLKKSNKISTPNVLIPKYLKKAFKNSLSRRRLMTTLHLNHRISRYKWLGKASSIFLINLNTNLAIDIFIEDNDNKRKKGPRLHDHLRNASNNYSGYPKLLEARNCVTLSGHMAPVIPSERYLQYILSLDAFNQPEECKNDDVLRNLIYILWKNRIIPVTSIGHPIPSIN